MTTLERLAAVFKEVFEDDIPQENLRADARLVEDLQMKSIGMLYMAMAVEQEFGVKFHNEDFGKLKTVQDIIDRIEAAGK